MTINFNGNNIELNEVEAYSIYSQIVSIYEKEDIHEFIDQYCRDNNLPEGSFDKYLDRVLETYRKLYDNDYHRNELIEEAFRIVVIDEKED